MSFAALRANPEAYKDRMISLGGTILGGAIARGRKEDTITYLEVRQHPLEGSAKPSVAEDTGGPFLLRGATYLDLSLYAKVRLITVAGRVMGFHTGQIDERVYIYPRLTCEELHLWSRSASAPELDDPDPWWYGAPWLSDDYWDYP